MKKDQVLKQIRKMCEKESFDEAFRMASDYNSTHSDEIFIEEDWQTIDGIEYYIVSVEDDVFKCEC